jgi:hypothetical protein
MNIDPHWVWGHSDNPRDAFLSSTACTTLQSMDTWEKQSTYEQMKLVQCELAAARDVLMIQNTALEENTLRVDLHQLDR